MGLQLKPEEIWEPDDQLRASPRRSPGSAAAPSSFVSPDGLIVTNHHCAFGAIQMNSTPEHDYITDGFLAAGRARGARRRSAQRVYVFKGYDDVTKAMTSVLHGAR